MPDRPDIPEEAVEAALSDAKVVASSVFGRIVVRAIEVAAPILLKEEAYRAEREMERADKAEAERDQALAKGAEEERERLRGLARWVGNEKMVPLAALDTPVSSEPKEGM